MGKTAGNCGGVRCTRNTGTPTHELIYETLVAHREEMRMESRKARLATRKLESTLLKISKVCFTFADRLANLQLRVGTLETDLGTAKGLAEEQLAQEE
ncbi:hypothetical protein NDU88_003280 [Pleurodeles waltl]|uniref:Uncharacterized protein n=1 Tax=Pleurodeles waltl TaxID=8319 RepID=A0AAV7W1P3_PLEWA|nr:hypothetical protein NDU88_003280 [Pleurodeles waltl]